LSLKSFEEILAFRGGKSALLDNIFETHAQRYRENNLRPIDSIFCWKNIKTTILLYFEVGDEKISIVMMIFMPACCVSIILV